MKTLKVKTRAEWRIWLEEHGESESEIWVVYSKKKGVDSLAYNDTVEDALCFGWIDSIIKRIDEDRYVRKFTPRKPGSRWSEVNKKRAAKMIKSGQMTARGQTLIDIARASGEWVQERERPALPDELPEELKRAFADHPDAEANFNSLAPTYRRQYVWWIGSAKRPDTRERRTAEAIQKLKLGEKLGMK